MTPKKRKAVTYHRDGCPKDKPASLGEYLALSTEDKMRLFKARQKRERASRKENK
jgi:hypothetical protein